MKYGELTKIFNEESDKYNLIVDEIDYVNHIDCREYRYAIVRDMENGQHYEVEYWTDSAGYGIVPNKNEELNVYEVELVKVVTTKWKRK